MKQCTKCNVFKPETEYYKHRGKLYPSCKNCKKELQTSKYVSSNPIPKSKTINEYQNCSKCNCLKPIDNFRYRKERLYFNTVCIECQRIDHICRTYNVSYLVALQLHNTKKCKICNIDVIGKNQCVDHEHSTGKIRGILCNNCNRALGYFNDSQHKLLNAIKYLKDNE